jgi:hypothetical protein
VNKRRGKLISFFKSIVGFNLLLVFYLSIIIVLKSTVVAVTLSGILKAKQKLEVTFNIDKQDVIDFMKYSKMTMCAASEANSKKSHRSFVFWAKNL